MIYLITATYAEAHPFIARFQLKKDSSHTRFQVFQDREADTNRKEICQTGIRRTGISLVISGPGPIPAAVAVSSICTEYGPGQGDFLLNVGICAGIREQAHAENTLLRDGIRRQEAPCQIGNLFLCNKITEQATGRTFYPDILYRHRFLEARIVTGSGIRQRLPHSASQLIEQRLPRIKAEEEDFYLYDMEAAAVYQAGAYFLGPHQMSFLKVISDEGDGRDVTPSEAERLIDRNMDAITEYISDLQNAAHEEQSADILQDDDIRKQYQTPMCSADQLIDERLCLDLHCSRAMSEALRQYIRYCVLAGIDYAAVLENFYREGKLPCKDKREGKQCFEELKKRLL